MATITEIASGDTLSASRSTINTNFDNLNTDKLEAADLPSASESAEGMVELATDAEALAGSSDSVVLTPGNLGYTGFLTGWIPAGETWTYASANTFTISGDKTDKYQKGDKIKLTNSSLKYFYIVGISYSSPNTTVEITGDDDYALVAGDITSPFYSKQENPQGFPGWFNWTPTWTGLKIGNATTVYKYTVIGKIVHIKIRILFGSTTSISDQPEFTPPVAFNNDFGDLSDLFNASIALLDAGTASYYGILRRNGNKMQIRTGSYPVVGISSTVPHTWAEGDVISVAASYEAS